MNEIFPIDFFRGNRTRLRKLFAGTAPIVITANGLMQKSGDEAFQFRQDTNFWYLTGLDKPDVTLVIDKDKEYLILAETSDYHEIFTGQTDIEAIVKRSGIDTVLSAQEGWKQLSTRLKKVKHVATLAALPPYMEVYNMYTNPARAALMQRMKVINPAIESLDLRQALARLRMVKQPLELTAMQQAIHLTSQAIKLVARKLNSFHYEYEVEAAITHHFLKHGSENSWKPIVASGENACTIHSPDKSKALSTNELVVIDIGAVVEHYSADIARTLVVGGKLSRRQKAVFDAVKEVQDFAFTLQRPGITVRDNESLVEQFMGEKLRELGLIKTIERDTVRKYFSHATSHYLGLDAHDAGDYDRPLEVGVVLTVEPGIYIPEEGIGVRIEDEVLITPSGHKILSARLPRLF